MIQAIHLRECLKPGLPTLLAHDSIGTPRGQRVIKSLVGRAYRLLALNPHSRVVEVAEIANTVIRRRRHDPGVTSITQEVSETIVILEQKRGLRRK